MKSVIQCVGLLGMALGVLACGDDDSFSPTEATVAGSYTATTFTLSSVVGNVNLLGAGATLTLNLASGGTTTGRLFVPAGNDDGSNLDEQLTGTWSLSGNTVTFEEGPDTDTFLPTVDFIASANQLTGEGSFSGGTLRLVLTKDS